MPGVTPTECERCRSYPAGTLCHDHFWDGTTTSTHPAVLEAREVIRAEEAERIAAQDDALHRFWRCLMLAPTLTICRALLNGEKVPDDQLDPNWLRRFRRRDAA